MAITLISKFFATSMRPARISDCELVNHEIGEGTMSSIVKLTFDDLENAWGDGGSPYQAWYRGVATGKDAVVDTQSTENSVFENCRLIAWKMGKPFKAENLFFRTVDSGRLLPMYLADFRIQFYAHRSFYEQLDAGPGGRKKWIYSTLSSYLHKILVLRNMHDKGGADIPIILTAWGDAHIERAMNYWADLSKGEWSEDEQRARYSECEVICRNNSLPCFPQTDILVRALLSDPEVGYVPPFIVIHSALPEGKTCVLFTKPLHFPLRSITDNWPDSCNSPGCTRTDCSPIDMTLSRSLVDHSQMVRKWDTAGPKRIVCNLWGCEARDQLLRCQRCKEVLYCSTVHQVLEFQFILPAETLMISDSRLGGAQNRL
ncbi:hypothetical protein B0H19DRAFT_1136097 [Mycena capillaripes]|nr:hypothetical protein B0H19DRAFT_1136097 [Mycena capillaripes]